MKNIRNNLLNDKKFVFPKFIYNDGLNIDISFPVGFIQWKDLYDIYDKDKGCQLIWIRFPNFLTNPSTQGITSKCTTSRAIIHEAAIAAARGYFPTRLDLSGFQI